MIYFILPVYNEENNIRKLILELRDVMSGKPYRIIAIDDASSDLSLTILHDLKADDLIIEGALINMNVGAVFSAGIHRVLSEAADEDIVLIMESDQTSSMDMVHKLIAEIESKKKDVAIASRYKEGGRYVNFPLARQIFSYGANFLMRLCFPIKGILDYTIFFRAYRVGIIRKTVKYFGEFGLIQSKGFVANAELLIKISLFTNQITEIPFVYNYAQKEGKSKINIFRTINEYFVLITYLKRIFKKVDVWQKKQNVNQ